MHYVSYTSLFDIYKRNNASVKYLNGLDFELNSISNKKAFAQRHSPRGVTEVVLRNFTKFTEKHLCQGLFFNKVAGEACNFIKKETLIQVFSCEFCEISKNIFSYRTPPVTAPD